MRRTKEERTAERQQRIDRLLKYQLILKAGVCPECGAKLYRNNSMTGWWQCGRLGAVGFQREPSPQHCDFQFFYDPTIQDVEELLRIAAAAEKAVQS